MAALVQDIPVTDAAAFVALADGLEETLPDLRDETDGDRGYIEGMRYAIGRIREVAAAGVYPD